MTDRRPDLPPATDLGGCHALVVGDVMLDEHLVGRVERTSPEAPVPVLAVSGATRVLGGAGHVAHLLRRLGATVTLVGVVGDDEAGDAVAAECRALGIDAALHTIPGRLTTRKVRATTGRQQIARLDWETTTPVSEDDAAALVAAIDQGAEPDLVIISDYAKGALVEAVVAAAIRRGTGVPVLVDPKRRDLEAYRGATLLKANRQEFEQCVGRAATDVATIEELGRELLARTGVPTLVVTLGQDGMVVVAPPDAAFHLPTEALEVYDVSGAGDTVIAVLGLALARGASMPDAAALANRAAGLAVQKAGVATVDPEELSPPPAGKVLDRAALRRQIERWRGEDQSVVLTNGCFDLFHVGHLHLLRQAASHGDRLVVAVDSDASVRRLKGEGRPVIDATERCALLGALDVVDAVVVFEGTDLVALLDEVRPDVLVKGADYELHEVVGRTEIEAHGGRVELVELLPGRSTSDVVRRIRSADAPRQANG